MRLLLVLLLVNGLTPALGEVVEAAVHLATTGHLAHSHADHGDLGDQGEEHGCGTTQHRCTCCASQLLAVGPELQVRRPAPVAAATRPAAASLTSLHEPAPPFRPPITA